ncbi:hypothetical protein GCM10020366_10310 [Saccharopolyspora gregorii]|uniref:DivIVA domain-containing protein n=1 Tax=Saccharopolyspora gregorii TaxID=33914 RepID=A0ABP6RNB5_9PSEU
MLAGYEGITLPQLRGRLRGFSTAEVEAMLDHERANQQRPSSCGCSATARTPPHRELTRRPAPTGNGRMIAPPKPGRGRSGLNAPANPPPTSAEDPLPVRTVARKIADWIHRLGTIWVEGRSRRSRNGPRPPPPSSPCATRPPRCR